MDIPASVRNFVERMQEHVIRAHGYAPEDVARLAEYLNEGGEHLTKDFGGHGVDTLCRLVFNERAYRTDAQAEAFFRDPTITRYDKRSIIQRFPNLIYACEHHLQKLNSDENVFFSTLPISILNGLCVLVDQDNTVIFLNEGALYCAPMLIRSFNDIQTDICHRVFHDGRVDLSADVEQQYRKRVAKFLDHFMLYASDRISPTTMEYGPGKPFLPAAYETWKLGKYLQKSILDKDAAEKFRDQIYTGPIDATQGNYYTARGFFLFLVGHEYGHFARQHIRVQTEGGPWFAEEYFSENLMLLRNLRPENAAIEVPEFAAYCFKYLQTLEHQADGDGIRVVVKYCEDHGLSKEQRMAMFSGIAILFMLTEMIEQMALLEAVGPEELQRQITLHPLERNMLTPREHPCAMSRIEIGIETVEDLSPQFKEEIVEAAQSIFIKGEVIWKTSGMHVFNHMLSGRFRLNNMLTINLRELFSQVGVMGAFGFPVRSGV